MPALALALFVLALASVAHAQAPTIVVVPFTTADGDPAAALARAEAVSLAIPHEAGSVVAVGETRARFEQAGSSEPPTVTATELEQWTASSREAVRQLADANYPAARAALLRAGALSERAAAELSREETRARQVLDTCLFGVRAYVEQEDPHAEDQALDCRRLVPRIAPSANIHTPEVIELLTRIDRRLAAAHRGPLRIDSQPEGCVVRLNGVTLGQTPFVNAQLAPGEYRVQVECGEVRGRVHRATIGDAPITLHIDARFDAAVRTDGAVRLAYADADDETAHLAIDAAAIGGALGATEVWLVAVRADGSLSGRRVRVEDGVVLATADGIAGGSTTALLNALRGQTAVAVPISTSDPTPGWAMVGSGAAVAIVGAILIGVGAGDLAAVSSPHVGETYAAAQSRQSSAELLTGIGGAALGVGVIAAGIGFGLALTSGAGEHASARLRVGPTSASITIEF